MMINQVMRYVPVLNILKNYGLTNLSNSNVKILEVGSGSNGIGDYIQFDFVGCDIKFDGKINSNLLPIISSSEQLPFKDDSFDVVLSSDMLEHIENKNRAKVVDELIRVSRCQIIIGCPCGKKSEIYEHKIALWYRLIHRKCPDWLSEHFENGLPSENDILQIIQKYHRYPSVLDNENVIVHMIIIMLESTPFGVVANKLAKLFLIANIGFYITKFLSFGTPYRKIFVVLKRD